MEHSCAGVLKRNATKWKKIKQMLLIGTFPGRDFFASSFSVSLELGLHTEILQKVCAYLLPTLFSPSSPLQLGCDPLTDGRS